MWVWDIFRKIVNTIVICDCHRTLIQTELLPKTNLDVNFGLQLIMHQFQLIIYNKYTIQFCVMVGSKMGGMIRSM